MRETTGPTPDLRTGGSGRALPVVGAEVGAAGPPPTPAPSGRWRLTPIDATDPAAVTLVTAWMASEHVAAHWRQAWPEEAWREELALQLAGAHSRPHLALLDGAPVGYVEVYRVARDVLAEVWPADPHDLGVHLALGDRTTTGRGLGSDLLTHVAEGLLRADPACRRVVGDPEAGHAAARGAFASAGFVLTGEVDLPHKRAAVMVRERSHQA